MAGKFRKAKITASSVDRMVPGETVGDTELDGFFVRRQKDARVYFVRKYARGQRHFETIGKHGAEYTHSKARNEALVVIAALKKGRDPALERTKLRQMPTVAEYAEEFLRENLPGLKPATLANYAGIYRNYIKSHLGNWKLDRLTVSDVAPLHRKMRSTPRAANHVIDFLGSLYKQARVEKQVPVDFNPCFGLKRFTINKRERYLLDGDVVHRSRVIQIYDQAEKIVQDGRIEGYIKEHLTEEFVAQIAKEFTLPKNIRPRLLAIAQFLHMASEGFSWPKSSDIEDELTALQNSTNALRARLKNLSSSAECAMGQLEEVPIEETGAAADEEETNWELDLPPINDFIVELDELTSWIDSADVPEGHTGPKLSAKYFAILMLRQELKNHKPGYTNKNLGDLADQVLESVRDKQGDDARLRDIVGKVMAENPLP